MLLLDIESKLLRSKVKLSGSLLLFLGVNSVYQFNLFVLFTL